jgi:glycosyltransferase involved in cell wall biosynthesis
MGCLVLVEPNPGGHRFQYVRHLVRAQPDAVVLTSAGATSTPEFASYLGDEPVEALERYSTIEPPTRELVSVVADLARERAVDTVVVMDADQALKRWWLEAPRAFRTLPNRPRVIFLLTRYPARLTLGDRLGWLHRISKASLSELAQARRSLARTVSLAGRDDPAPGRLVHRAQDPALCDASSADRAALREKLDLPASAIIVGILGTVSDRKNVPMVAEAVRAVGDGTRLLLAGQLDPFVSTWLADQPPALREVLIVRDEYLSNEQLDAYVAASDIVSIAQDNNGPSGIMGKALAAGVPVLTAGSLVRERELTAAGPWAGRATALTVDATADGLRALIRDRDAFTPADRTLLASPEAFAARVLGR